MVLVPLPRALAFCAAALITCGGAACSVRKLAVRSIASSLAESGDVFASDDDPELVRDALPFALKTIEALLVQDPGNTDLALAACRGFTQYAYAFVEADADLIAEDDWTAAKAMRDRALKLYLRARDYGLHGLSQTHAGLPDRLRLQPDEAARELDERDLPLVFWTGSAWGAAVSLGIDRPDIVADVDAVRALLRRCIELGEDYAYGAVHQAMIRIEALPEMMGGSRQRAREHFERAVVLSEGHNAAPFVTYATAIAVAEQDRSLFDSMLERALSIDPDVEPSLRLSNCIERRRAQHLVSIGDDLFLEPLD